MDMPLPTRTTDPAPPAHAHGEPRIGNEIWFDKRVAERELDPVVPASRDLWFNVVLAIISLALFALLVFLKAKTVASVHVDAALVVYTSFVTLFQLSRLVTALMYRRSYRAALDEDAPADPATLPKISFVIPCMNEENEIQNTIATCYAAHYPLSLIHI